MAYKRVNLLYDDERDSDIGEAIANHSEVSDAEYLRKCVRHFEASRLGRETIADKLTRLEKLLKSGVVVASGGGENEEDSEADLLLDDILSQFG